MPSTNGIWWWRVLTTIAVVGLVIVAIIGAVKFRDLEQHRSPCTDDASSKACQIYVCQLATSVGLKTNLCDQILLRANLRRPD